MTEDAASKTLQKGFLIALEGIDGAGKTTQAQLLVAKLQSMGYPVVSLHEPTDGKYGQIIRAVAKGKKPASVHEELEFFLQDRIEDVERNIRPALAAGKIVVMDRYYFSSIAYQGARGLDLAHIEELNLKIAPVPDLLLILDIKPLVSLNRIRQNRAEGPNMFENSERLEKSRTIFNSFKDREYVCIVEANGQQSPCEVAENIWGIVETFLLCAKGKFECEPEYCTFRITDTCDYLHKKQKK